MRLVVFAVFTVLIANALSFTLTPPPWQGKSDLAEEIRIRSIVPLVKEVRRVHSPGEGLIAQGCWQLTTDSDYVRLPAVNSVEITCLRRVGLCLGALALLHTSVDADFEWLWDGKVNLRPRTFEYQIVEWTSERIYARHSVPR